MSVLVRQERPTLDVSRLRTWDLTMRSPVAWGAVLLMAIEGTMFVLLGASYLDLRSAATRGGGVWPYSGMPTQLGVLALVAAALFVASVPVMLLLSRAAMVGRLRRVRALLVFGTALGLLFLALQFVQMKLLPFRWDTHAQGSAFWMIWGLHTFDLIATLLENLIMIALLFRGPVEKHHMLDVRVGVWFWNFMVGTWLVLGGLLFLDPLIFGGR